MVNYGVSRGCETCKKRRKKCDEARPVCERCSRLGITCHGYQHGTDYVFRNTTAADQDHQAVSKRNVMLEDLRTVRYSDDGSKPQVGQLTRRNNPRTLVPKGQQSPESAFGVSNQIPTLFRPLLPRRPTWSSQAALHVTDDEWSSLHSYWAWVPNKTYPFKALLAYNPTESRDYYYAIINNEASVRSVLMMRTLMIAVSRGEHRSEEVGCHVSKVCATVNKELNSNLERTSPILLEVISVLALVAAYLGLYHHWHVHMNGLKKMIEINGGVDALSPELSTKLRRADLKGASALLVAPHLSFRRAFENASDILPLEVRSAVSETTRDLLLPCGVSTQTINNIVSLSIFARALTLAQHCRTPRSIVFDPYAVTEEWQWCQYQLICSPSVLHSSVLATRCMSWRVSDIGLSWDGSIELVLRICAILYTKEMVFCRDWPRNLSGYSVPLDFILRHVEAICRCHGRKSVAAQHIDDGGSRIDPLSKNPNTEYGALRKPMLIWICLFANAVSRIANRNEDRLESDRYDCSIYRVCIVDVVGLATEDIDALSEDDLMLCRLLDLRNITGQEWDDRLGLRDLLEGTSN